MYWEWNVLHKFSYNLILNFSDVLWDILHCDQENVYLTWVCSLQGGKLEVRWKCKTMLLPAADGEKDSGAEEICSEDDAAQNEW